MGEAEIAIAYVLLIQGNYQDYRLQKDNYGLFVPFSLSWRGESYIERGGLPFHEKLILFPGEPSFLKAFLYYNNKGKIYLPHRIFQFKVKNSRGEDIHKWLSSIIKSFPTTLLLPSVGSVLDFVCGNDGNRLGADLQMGREEEIRKELLFLSHPSLCMINSKQPVTLHEEPSCHSFCFGAGHEEI